MTVALSVRIPVLIAVVVMVPHLLYPKGLRTAVADLRPQCLLDAYLQLLEEGSDDVGFLEGLWRFRHLAPDVGAETVSTPGSWERTKLVP
jgi:hypothetical protein